MTTVAKSNSLLSFKTEFLKKYENNITQLLSNLNIPPMQFMATVVNQVQKTPKLLDCTKESLFGAIVTCAELGLMPSNQRGEAYLIPYGKECQFQLGYQGFVTLLYRSGVSSLNSGIIFEKDHYEYELGENPKLVHRPVIGERGKPIAAYAIVKIKDEKIFRLMSESEIMEIKKLSKASNSSFSPWTKNDPERWMWQKTVIKQLAKTLPKSDVLSQAIYVDNVMERGGKFSEEKGKVEIVEEPFNETGDAKKEALKNSNITKVEMP